MPVKTKKNITINEGETAELAAKHMQNFFDECHFQTHYDAELAAKILSEIAHSCMCSIQSLEINVRLNQSKVIYRS